MFFKGVSRPAVIACAIFYGVVFVTLRYPLTSEHMPRQHGQLGMLLFMLPGVLSALTSRQSPLSVALFGPLLATPFCLLVMVMGLLVSHNLWQEFAFGVSGIFWCGLGALGVMLGRTLLVMRHGGQP